MPHHHNLSHVMSLKDLKGCLSKTHTDSIKDLYRQFLLGEGGGGGRLHGKNKYHDLHLLAQ